MFVARQGDILIVATTTIPKNAKPVARENGRTVLAHGEVTGHCHAIDDPTVLFLATDLGDLTDRFLRVERECRVVHDEHDAITLPPGEYIIRRQREYQSSDMAPIQVAD
jgi:hypothetical protein